MERKGAGSRVPGAGSRVLGAGCREQGAGSRVTTKEGGMGTKTVTHSVVVVPTPYTRHPIA